MRRGLVVAAIAAALIPIGATGASAGIGDPGGPSRPPGLTQSGVERADNAANPDTGSASNRRNNP